MAHLLFALFLPLSPAFLFRRDSPRCRMLWLAKLCFWPLARREEIAEVTLGVGTRVVQCSWDQRSAPFDGRFFSLLI